MRIVIIHTSQGLREDQTREKGCENYINRKALHKEGSYDWLIPSQSVFQRKLNKLPQTFHSQGYFYFVIFQASKWNWKKNKKPSAAVFYMVVYKSRDEIEIMIAPGPKFTFSEGGRERGALMTLGRAAEITNARLALTSLCSFKWSNQACFSQHK